jgi:hypothetical protein
MAERPLTRFKRVKKPIEAIRECMGDPSSNPPPEAVWWDSFLARDTVVYESGRIARKDDPVRHRVDPEELALCRALAAETHSFGPVEYPSSEGEFQWDEFYVAANVADPIPKRIDEDLIREQFGGTIIPLAPFAIAPIIEAGPWWATIRRRLYYRSHGVADNVLKIDRRVWWKRCMSVARMLFDRDLKIYGEKGQRVKEVARIVKALNPDSPRPTPTEKQTASDILDSLGLVRFYRRSDFRDAAYVTIGIGTIFGEGLPAEFGRYWSSSKPILVLGLTQAGSLTGLMGYTVRT